MEWIITLVIGAVLAVILDISIRALGRRVGRPVGKRLWRWRLVRDVHGHTPVGVAALEATAMPTYFREVGPAILDVGVYELSLRPNIPIMDLLYFEYLRRRLLGGTLRKVLVVPWSGRGEADAISEGEELLGSRLEAVFGSEWPKVEMLRSRDLDKFAHLILSEHFMDSLEDLGNSQFLRDSSRTLGYRFRSFHDINSGHPESLQARSLVEHSIRGWLIFKYLTASDDFAGRTSGIAVGSLLWERELSKLLLLKNLQESGPSPDIGLMIGRSVTYRSGYIRRPLPTYVGAIELFEDATKIEELCQTKSASELAVSLDIVTEVLSRQQRKLIIGPGQSETDVVPHQSSRYAQALVAQLAQLRNIYGSK